MRKISYCLLLFTFSMNVKAQTGKVFFTSKEISRVAVNTNYYYQPKAFDSANNAINYSVKNLPAWLSWNTGAQSVSGKAIKAGQYTVDMVAYKKRYNTSAFYVDCLQQANNKYFMSW